MAYRGDYDPSGFVQADPGTWPTPAPYSPGDWWNVTGPGTVNGTAVDLGDRVYPVGTGRLYGEDNYGDGMFGGPVPDPPWPADSSRVTWRGAPWTTAPGWDRFPGPYAGEPFGDTGWRLAVEVYLPDPSARLYGSDEYGSGEYGDTVVPPEDWQDVTCPVASVIVNRGAQDGRPYSDVDAVQIDLVDQDAVWLPITTADNTEDGILRTATVGTPVRVAFVAPDGEPFPLFTGRLDDTTDEAERPPRIVQVNAYGMGSDLAVSRSVDRPSETVGDRLASLRDVSGYSWGWEPPTDGSQVLRRTDRVVDAIVRQMIDRTALSAGLQWATDARGVVTFHEWPVPLEGTPLVITDRIGTSALAASIITTRQDTVETLNDVAVGSEPVQGSGALVSRASDGQSVGRFGSRGTALGFPIMDLSAQQTDLDDLAAGIVDRYGRIVNRVSSVDVNTRTDPRWLAVLADLAPGDSVQVEQTNPIRVTWDAVVTGYEYRILARPARVDATIYLSTANPTI